MSIPQDRVHALLDAAEQAIRTNNPLPVAQCLVDASYFLASCPQGTPRTTSAASKLMRVERAYKALLTDLLGGTAAVEWVTITRRTNDPKLKWLEGQIRKLRIPTRRCGESFHAPIMQVPSTFVAEAEAIVFKHDDEPDTWAGGPKTSDNPPQEVDEDPPDFFGVGVARG